MVPHWRSCYKECTCEIWKPYLFWLRIYGQGKSFLKVGQISRSRSLGQKFWYRWKGLVTRNVHMKALPLLVRKLWPRLKFLKVGQTARSRSLGQKFWYPWRGLVTRNVHMKSLPLLVRKLWPRLKFFKSRSNFKVKVTRSKILVIVERSCHKDIHVKYESANYSSSWVMGKVKVFVHTDADGTTIALQTFVLAS